MQGADIVTVNVVELSHKLIKTIKLALNATNHKNKCRETPFSKSKPYVHVGIMLSDALSLIFLFFINVVQMSFCV